MQTLSVANVKGGAVHRCQHESTSTKTKMTFSVFVPRSAHSSVKAPVLFYLSGLTCNDENFHKAAAWPYAAAHNIALVIPDTSPRGANLPNEGADWQLGLAAGWYIDATEAPWNAHYKMRTYITQELPALVAANFAQLDINRRSIFGHRCVVVITSSSCSCVIFLCPFELIFVP